ncbi:MAG TPA: signal recognition particle-docking protein FtsY [Polyangiaceae bacterium]|jgi:fused signal recognition particle receptor
MDAWVYVIVGIVAAAILYFAFIRKPAQLPPKQEGAHPLPPGQRGGKELGPGEAKPSTTPASKPPPPPTAKAPEALASSDVLPPSEKAAAAPAAPPSRPLSKQEVAGMRKGLAATRGGFIARLTALFSGKKEIDPAILEQIEEVMISSDVGVKTTQAILGRLRERLAKNELADTDAVWAALRAEAAQILSIGGGALRLGTKPTVVLMVGVNGVGKTTSIGKLATRSTNEGKKVLLAAGDTFRAAAVQQLEVWGKRVGVDVVKGKEGADPGAVAFDATTKAKEAAVDLLFVDTAGRLHTKAPLMDEIKKIRKTIAKAMDGAPHETLLVLDATTGQNALTQAALFKDAVDLTGIILTKLDGTAKGGIVLGICDELKVPVRYIGLGERAEDLREFKAEEFVEALFGRDGDEAAAA